MRFDFRDGKILKAFQTSTQLRDLANVINRNKKTKQNKTKKLYTFAVIHCGQGTIILLSKP